MKEIKLELVQEYPGFDKETIHQTKAPEYPQYYLYQMSHSRFRAITFMKEDLFYYIIAEGFTQEEAYNKLVKKIQEHLEYLERITELKFRYTNSKKDIIVDGFYIGEGGEIISVSNCSCCTSASVTREEEIEAYVVVNEKEYILR